MNEANKPYVLAREEGEHYWYLGGLLTVKADAAKTGGAFSLVEELLPVGFQTPYHVHRFEDETFYIIDGEAEFIIDGQLFEANAGAFVYLPLNVPHGFRVTGQSPARVLNMVNPSGFDRFFIELGEPAQSLELPAPAQPDIPKMLQILSKYDVKILGPLNMFFG